MARRVYNQNDIVLKSDREIINIIKSVKKSTTKTSKTLTVTEIQTLIDQQTKSATNVGYGGNVVGRLIFSINGYKIDCTKHWKLGVTIPYDINTMTDVSSDALFILLVEMDCSYHTLAHEEFYNRFPCILVSTERKQPNMTTCSFLWKLKTELNLPVLALVHGNPNSLKKLSVYGSNNKLIDIKWLGIRHSDLEKYKIWEECTLKMSVQDIKTCEGLLEDEEFVENNSDNGWVDELKLMLKMKSKLEIEAVYSLDGGYRDYLIDFYLPSKLQELNRL